MTKTFVIQKEITFPKKDYKGKICLDPFMSISIDLAGNVGLCSCGFWQPTKIGNIKNNSIDEMLQSELAQRIRDSIRNSTYEYCDDSRCGLIINNQLTTVDMLDKTDSYNNSPSTYDRVMDTSVIARPRYFYIAGDIICNLSCPSCRTRVIAETPEQREGRTSVMSLLNQQVFNGEDPRPIVVYLGAGGDMFASPLVLDFLKTFPLDRYPKTEFHFQTNGLLFKKRWDRINHLRNNIVNVAITIDSHLPDVYAKLRRGGNMADIIENLNFIRELKQELDFKFSIRMVVQKDNYTEVKDFYDFVQQFDVTNVEFMRILNWGTYTPQEFAEIDVLDPKHVDYETAIFKFRELKMLHDDRVILYHFNI